MDGAGGNNSNAGTGGSANPQQQQLQQPNPADRSRAVRAELEAKRRQTVERRRYYQPLVRQQIVRVFGDIKPAWYARLRLMTPSTYAGITEYTLLNLAIENNEVIPDSAARVITEHVAKGADRSALITWGLVGVAGYYAWRGRRSFRFPFYSPTSVSGISQVRTVLHAARFAAYYVCVTFAIQGPLMGINYMYTNSQIKNDARLDVARSGYDHEEQQQAGVVYGAGMDGYSSGGSYQYQNAGDGGLSQQQQQQQQSIAEAAQPGWDNYKQASPAAGQQRQSRAGWGDNSSAFDDASPVAFSQPQNDNSYNDNSSSGSSWDRLRRQSQGAPRQQQPQQPSGQQSGGGGWGDSGDGVDRAAQEKAQKDFDRLVEQDRGSEGQGRSWGSR